MDKMINEGYGIPTIGEKFPKLVVQTTAGKLKLLEHFKGRWFVLFSHPADFTPVCTTEFVAFQKRYKDFKKLNCELIGLSIDQVFSHIKWKEWIKDNLNVKIESPIIADDRGDVACELGMVHSEKGNNTVRAVFVIDPRGIIRAIIYYPQEVGRNMNEILRLVKALQTADKGYATPANWPNNELVKDEVIIPPASDEKTASKRQKEYNCFDWWFCHKKLKK